VGMRVRAARKQPRRNNANDGKRNTISHSAAIPHVGCWVAGKKTGFGWTVHAGQWRELSAGDMELRYI
jgi:hypothetical protein